MMKIDVYRNYLKELVKEALENSDRSVSGISQYLWDKKITGLFVRNREEKQRALEEARKAFDEHRHWPLAIIISHLGLDPDELDVSM
jgi:hypothetical protein